MHTHKNIFTTHLAIPLLRKKLLSEKQRGPVVSLAEVFSKMWYDEIGYQDVFVGVHGPLKSSFDFLDLKMR
jgi:hypothetical protein